jgi:hypothetical protein
MKGGKVGMSEELKLIEGILVHAEDEKTNRSWASDDVGWENMDAIWHKAEQLKKLLKEQETVAKCDRCLFVKRDKLRKVIETDEFKCPACKKRVAGRMTDGTVLLETPGDDLPDYCCFCGQRLDWDIEEAVSQ